MRLFTHFLLFNTSFLLLNTSFLMKLQPKILKIYASRPSKRCKRTSLTGTPGGGHDCKQSSRMHDVSCFCFHTAVMPNHSNSEHARRQQWDTSVANIWSNSNCWGDVACASTPMIGRADTVGDNRAGGNRLIDAVWACIRPVTKTQSEGSRFERMHGKAGKKKTTLFFSPLGFKIQRNTLPYTSETILKFNIQCRDKEKLCCLKNQNRVKRVRVQQGWRRRRVKTDETECERFLLSAGLT